jgi:hypothetical protein
MTDVRIRRLELRGRLPGTEAEARARAEHLLGAACGELLERALERAGVRDDGELCIRALDVDAHLPLERGDAAMAAAWSLRVAEVVRAAVETGGPDVVRYDSVAQALADVLGSASQGDFRRAWAWSQLGLWPGGDGVRGVVAALTARPELCAPALREAAARGRLVPLLRALPADAWAGVARAALASAGVAPELFDAEPSPAREDAAPGPRAAHPAAGAPATQLRRDERDGEAGAPAALRARARRVAATSPLCLALERAAAFGLAPLARRALGALALLDADPTALRGARARDFVAALDDELRARGDGRAPGARGAGAAAPPLAEAGSVPPPRPAARETETRGKGESAHARAGGRDAGGPREAAEPLQRDGVVVPAEASRAAADAAPRPATERAADREAEARPAAEPGEPKGATAREEEHATRAERPNGATSDEAALDDDFVDADGDHEPPVARQRGRTRFAGLLFLLHVVDALGLPDEWSETGPLAARPLRAALHALALALLRDAGCDDVAPDDPAVLAFAGLRPGAPPPLAMNGATETQRPQRNETDENGAAVSQRSADASDVLTLDEQAAIDGAARRIAETLAVRILATNGATETQRAQRNETEADGAVAPQRAADALAAPEPPLPRHGGEGRGEGEGDAPASVNLQPSPYPSPAGAGEGSTSARDLAAALAEHIAPSSPCLRASMAALSPSSPLAALVARRAEIVADPGWIEARLALEEIDTRVRRAGLDLDPGYLPWLGVVVKFRYV